MNVVARESDPLCGYEDAAHAYSYADEQWPGVSTLLHFGKHVETKWFTEEARSRGTRVHHATLGIDYDCADSLELASDISGEVAAYKRFLREIRPDYLCAEEPRWHKTLRFAGRPDRICRRIRGFPGILEIKTGHEADWHALQLAGYQLLHPAGARWVVYLLPTGRYRLRRHDNPADYGRFMRTLNEYWKQQEAA